MKKTNKNIDTTIATIEKIHGNCNATFCITTGGWFNSQEDAAKVNDVSTSAVSLVCRGLQRCTKGLRFCLVTDIPNHIVEISQNMAKLHSENVEKDKELADMKQAHKEVEKDAQMFLKVMSDKLKAIAG